MIQSLNRLLKFAILPSIIAIYPLSTFAEEAARASLKAEYNQIHVSKNRITGIREPYIDKYILQVAPETSYYYDPQTFLMDSLENDPNGRVIIRKATDEAYQAFYNDPTQRPHETLRKQGFVSGNRYRCLKDFTKGSMRVWDSVNGDKYRYDVEMNDMEWTPLDSVKTILGYECQLAETVYHGRKWRAWFAPEIPVADGPWQLHGLPGLIMEASTPEGSFSFCITGLQKCNEPLKPIFKDDKYFISKRKSVNRLDANSSRNRSGWINGMTKGAVKIETTNEEDEILETDYKD